MKPSSQRPIAVGLLGLLLTTGISGCSATPSDNVTPMKPANVTNTTTSQPTITTISEPPIPTFRPLPVTHTTLSQSTVSRDVRSLQALFQAHTGDGITRGPDQLVYNIDATISPSLHQIGGDLQVHFRNNLDKPMSIVYFNVWPDAPHFRKSGGYMSISNVRMNQQSTSSRLQGTVLYVPLSHPIMPGQVATISMNFQALLPHIEDRYGWNGTTMDFGNWFPILAVHDQYGWVTPPYYSDGESFYSLTGDFHLHVTAPKNFPLAITGQEIASIPAGNQDLTHVIEASGVRDVAMVGDSTYQVSTGKVGDTTILTYYAPAEASQANLMRNVAERAVRYYNTHYGTYPYPTLRVCTMNASFGGMEYPQLVMISFGTSGNTPAQTTEYVSHEVAHQWFYGMVGDDEYLTPWLDESFATFSEERVDKRQSDSEFAPRSTMDVSDPVSAFTSSDFDTHPTYDYFYSIYMGGARVLNQLMTKIGQPKFDEMMRSYFEQYQYRVVTSQDFIQAASKAYGRDLTELFSHDYLINASDDLHAPVRSWATLEMKENGRDWH